MANNDSFDFILPSNASADLYPDNSAALYTTTPASPLQLDGQWEVGVKSIFYNSNLGHLTEKGRAELEHTVYRTRNVNDVYDVTYRTTADGKWDYSWRNMGEPFNTKEGSRDVYTRMNAINNTILAKKGQKVLYLKHYVLGLLTYNKWPKSLEIRLDSRLASFFVIDGPPFLPTVDNPSKRIGLAYYASGFRLSKENMEYTIFDRNVVQRDKRITLKEVGESWLSRDVLIKRWKERVRPIVESSVGFTGGGKLAVTITIQSAAFVFNHSFVAFAHIRSCIFAKGTYTADAVYSARRTKDGHESEHWFVDIYTDKLRTTRVHEVLRFGYDLFPRKLTIQQLMTSLSEAMSKFLKSKKVDDGGGKVQFTLRNDLTHVSMPNHSVITLSANVTSALGMASAKLYGPHALGTVPPATLDMREQELFIFLNITATTNYGDEKLQLVQHFIHSKALTAHQRILERYFDPIVYLPVAKHTIESVTLKINGGHQEEVLVRDGKTIVTLNFRRL